MNVLQLNTTTDFEFHPGQSPNILVSRGSRTEAKSESQLLTV